MRPGTALAAYIIFIFAGAALIAPWVAYAPPTSIDVPFRRVVNRCLLGLALIGTWPLIRALGFRSWKEIGIREDVPVLKHLGFGILVGTTLLWIVAGSALLEGSSQWDSTHPITFGIFLAALASAILVGFLEELLFRGAIFTALRRTWSDASAIWISSGIYAITHFFARPPNPAKIEWHSGFLILWGMMRGFGDFQTVIPGFLNLTLLGIIFVMAFRKTGTLWLSIGMHTALILWVKLYAVATNPTPNANLWFGGTEKLIDGWFGCIILSLCLLPFARKPR